MNKTKLGEICNIVMGQSPQGTSYNEVGDGVPLINGPTEFTEKYPIKRQWTNKPTKMCKKDDVLLCVRGSSTGRMNISNDEYCIGRGVAAISGKKDKALTDYIYYLLDFEVNNILLKSTGSTFPNVTSKELNELSVFLFDKDDQIEIVKILKSWDKTIELKEKLLQEKQKQKKGLMERLLTGKVRLSGFNEKWKQVKLGSAIDVIKKEALPTPQDYNLLTVKLHVKGIEATDKRPNATEKGRPYYLRMPGELLIGRQNFHNGGIGIVPNDMNDYIASNAITSLKVVNGDLQFYFYYLSNFSFYKRVDNIIGGTGQKEISETMLKKLKVTVPTNIEEQKQIAKIIGVANAEVELLEKEIVLLKEQKKGLMQLLLTGIVRVKCD